MPADCISCIVCAYNEAERIDRILQAALRHPLISEVIVVNDGSTDDTHARVAAHPEVRLISYPDNRGKTHALACGIAAARCDHLMFLDADLTGLEPEDLDALAAPVLSGEADVSMSLRGNSLGVCKLMGLDFISGERVIPAKLLREAAKAMLEMPRWSGEVFMNELIIGQGLRVAVVDWPQVRHTPKSEKTNAWKGLVEEVHMIGDTVKMLTVRGLVRQNFALLKLVSNPHKRWASA
jgi:glycosyltransferase involved in cell wall biosynthesis